MREALYQVPTWKQFDVRKELLFFDKIYLPKHLIEVMESAGSYNKNGIDPDRMNAEISYLIDHGQVEIIDIEQGFDKIFDSLNTDGRFLKEVKPEREVETRNFLSMSKAINEIDFL
tara:strand:- start:2128 stop:2475 length:348 start_codon:yes stop_codon:yes gene_type:complete